MTTQQQSAHLLITSDNKSDFSCPPHITASRSILTRFTEASRCKMIEYLESYEAGFGEKPLIIYAHNRVIDGLRIY